MANKNKPLIETRKKMTKEEILNFINKANLESRKIIKKIMREEAQHRKNTLKILKELELEKRLPSILSILEKK